MVRSYEQKSDESSNTDDDEFSKKYRSMNWWQAGFVIVAETVSLGVLSLPSVLAAVGIVPGLILIVGLGCVTTYTGYVFGQFKLAYPQVNSIADVGHVLLGPVGRELFTLIQVIYLIFIAGSHLLTFTIAFNAITARATCTIAWSVVGLVVFVVGTLPRTLKGVSWLGAASFVSLFASVLIAMISLGASSSGTAHIDVTHNVAFYSGMGATAQVIFAYSGHITFFTVMNEFKDPRDFPKSLLMLQIIATTIYTVAAAVIYVYAGEDVSSPALGSLSPVVSRVAYGIALVTIVGAGVVVGHVNSKAIYIRIFQRRPNVMAQRSFLSLGTWVAIVCVNWVIAWIIAESIPVFNDLIGLVASIFASWDSYGWAGVLWLYINRGQYFKNVRKASLTLLNVAIVGLGAAIMGLGMLSDVIKFSLPFAQSRASDRVRIDCVARTNTFQCYTC